MEDRLELKNQRNRSFNQAMVKIRPVLALANAILVIIAIFTQQLQQTTADTIIVFSYLVLSLACLTVPVLKKAAQNSLYGLLLGIDCFVVIIMILRTGGVNSELVPFLWIPVIVAGIRYKYTGVLVWCSVMAVVLIAIAFISDTISIGLIVKVGIFYLSGILSSYLVRQTYLAAEETPNRSLIRDKDLKGLDSFLQEMSQDADVYHVGDQIVRFVTKNTQSAMVALMILDERGMLNVHFITFGWQEEWIASYEKHPLTTHSLAMAPILVFKEPILCTDICKHPELVKTFEGIPIESFFAFPLVVDNDVAGAIVLTDHSRREMANEEVQALLNIANQAGMAFHHVASIKEEKLKADTDGLTGLYNRRYFNEQIEELVFEAQQRGTPLSLLMIDVDNFKHYNDTYGHPAGDILLKKVADVIGAQLRGQDIVARYGGEEFVVILRNTDNRLAMQIADRIRQGIQDLPTGVLKSTISASLGAATLPDHAKDRVTLVEYADKSLYHAKHAGKNRVCCGF